MEVFFIAYESKPSRVNLRFNSDLRFKIGPTVRQDLQ